MLLCLQVFVSFASLAFLVLLLLVTLSICPSRLTVAMYIVTIASNVK